MELRHREVKEVAQDHIANKMMGTTKALNILKKHSTKLKTRCSSLSHLDSANSITPV